MGTAANDGVCLCGASSICTHTTGLYCKAADSTCSAGAACTNVDGSSPNDKDCACGVDAAVCAKDTSGRYCVAALSGGTCFKTKVHSDCDTLLGIRITAGKCTDIVGRRYVASKEECARVGQRMGFSEVVAVAGDLTGLPRGCYWTSWGSLWFTKHPDDQVACSSARSCLCVLDSGSYKISSPGCRMKTMVTLESGEDIDVH